MDAGGLKYFFLYRKILFPYCNLTVSAKGNIIGKISAGNRVIAVPARNIYDFLVTRNRIATLAEIVEIKKVDGVERVTMKGVSRLRVRGMFSFNTPCFDLIEEGNVKSDGLIEELRKKSQELIFLINVEESDRMIQLLNYIVNLNHLTDFVSNYFVIKFHKRYGLFNEIDLPARAGGLLRILEELIGSIKIKKEHTATDEKKRS
jgi:hypothetical protein